MNTRNMSIPAGRKARRTAKKAPWITTGEFECYSGRWKGGTFCLPPELVEVMTEQAASRDGTAVIREHIRADGSERRFTARLVVSG